MATTRRRPGCGYHHPVNQWHEPLGDDASTKCDGGHGGSADSWLGLSGHSDVQEWRAEEPIKNHRQDRWVVFFKVISSSFLLFSSSSLDPVFSSSTGVPPLSVSILQRQPPPVLVAPGWSLGELPAFLVWRLQADSQHHPGPGGSKLLLPCDVTNTWEVIQSCAESGEWRTDGWEQLWGSNRSDNNRKQKTVQILDTSKVSE